MIPMPSRELGERWPNLLAVGGHPAVDMPPHVVEAASRAAQRAQYAPTRGLPALREAIAAEHGVDPDRNVIVTLGGMQGLYLAARAFVGDGLVDIASPLTATTLLPVRKVMGPPSCPGSPYS